MCYCQEIDEWANRRLLYNTPEICGEVDMGCCRERVLLKGCHDNRIRLWESDAEAVGGMCCIDGIS